METINFTTRVLGQATAYRLEKCQVNQTLRSENDTLTTAILNGRVGAGDLLEVILDGIVVGDAKLLSMTAVTWNTLNVDDALRGGFDSLKDLEAALKRAGFRFQPLNDYHLFRIQFRWLEKIYA